MRALLGFVLAVAACTPHPRPATRAAEPAVTAPATASVASPSGPVEPPQKPKPVLSVVLATDERLSIAKTGWPLAIVRRTTPPRIYSLSDSVVRRGDVEKALGPALADLETLEGGGPFVATTGGGTSTLHRIAGGQAQKLASVPGEIEGAWPFGDRALAHAGAKLFVADAAKTSPLRLPAQAKPVPGLAPELATTCKHLLARAPHVDGDVLWAAGAPCHVEGRAALLRFDAPGLEPKATWTVPQDGELLFDATARGAGQVLFAARRAGASLEAPIVILALDPATGAIGVEDTGVHASSIESVGEDALGDRWLLVANAAGRTLVRRHDGAWRAVPVVDRSGAPLEIETMRASPAHGVWAVARGGGRDHLLHDAEFAVGIED